MVAMGGGGGSLPIYLTEDLEKLQRRANFPIIYLKLAYVEVLAESNVVNLFDSEQDI